MEYDCLCHLVLPFAFNMKKFKYGYGLLVFGLVMIALFWWVNWSGTMLRTHWAFFPLWIGYITTADAIAVLRGRPSLFLRTPWLAGGLFALSAPLWWLFEWMNDRAGYWTYLPEEAFGPLEHMFWSTLCFSTVVPAIFATVNALLSFQVFQRHIVTIRAGHTRVGRLLFFVTGWVMLISMFVWPEYGMAFMWMSVYFILDPLNIALNRPALMDRTRRGDWRMVMVLFCAALICGLFWELWNWHAWPKWVYTFPYLNGVKNI